MYYVQDISRNAEMSYTVLSSKYVCYVGKKINTQAQIIM